jgi:hypothetical protein
MIGIAHVDDLQGPPGRDQRKPIGEPDRAGSRLGEICELRGSCWMAHIEDEQRALFVPLHQPDKCTLPIDGNCDYRSSVR